LFAVHRSIVSGNILSGNLEMQHKAQAGSLPPLRCLEFYSGVGGMHCALTAACPGAAILRAYDISPAANDAYEFVFGKRPWQVSSLIDCAG
jgi:hypothetical protein